MKKNESIGILLVMTILGLVGGFFYGRAYELTQMRFVLPEHSWQRTEMFKAELECAKEVARYVQTHEGKVYEYEAIKPYEEWKMVELFETKFGYRETEEGIEIIVGNHDGSETETALIDNATSAKVIQMEYEYNAEEKICINAYSNPYLLFEVDGVKYAMSSNLNVWECVS